MINEQDRHKIRTACYIYLRNNKGATSKQLLNYINEINLPLKVRGVSSQALSSVLSSSSVAWGFLNQRNSRGVYMWGIRRQ